MSGCHPSRAETSIGAVVGGCRVPVPVPVVRAGGGQRENMEGMAVFVQGRCRSGAPNHLAWPSFEELSKGRRSGFVWLIDDACGGGAVHVVIHPSEESRRGKRDSCSKEID